MAQYFTAEEAVKQWCPHARCVYTDPVSLQNWYGINRLSGAKLDNKCIGPTDGCMAWEKGPDREKTDGTTPADNFDPNGRIILVKTGRCGMVPY